MNIIATSIRAAALVVLSAFTALAQGLEPRHAVAFVGGAASGASTTGVTLGGSWLFDMSQHASLEAQGTYLDRGSGADAVSIGGSFLMNILPARGRRIVPFAAVGGGLYHSSFDLSDAAFLGPNQPQFAPGSLVCPAPGTGIGPGPGAGFGPGTGTCPATAAGYWGVGQMPGFYARRLGPMTVPPGGVWQTRSFTDPAVSFGGGLRFDVNERLMVRPDARALVVFADGDTHTLGVFGVHVGYRF
jgi:hypothetical protein